MMFYSRSIVVLLVATLFSQCSGGALSRQKRVVGGKEYSKGDYPFHVSLWYMGDNNPYTANTPNLHHTCGGTLIGNQWVLTSGTCFDENFLPGLSNTSLWKVYLGMHAQTAAEIEAQYHTIDQIFTAPEYSLSESYGDVALLKLDRPVTFNENVGLGLLNFEHDCPAVDQEVTLIGWGQTQAMIYGLGSDVPREATLKVDTLKHCQDKYLAPDFKKYGFRIDETILCAGLPQGGVDGCYGDSGSPLLAKCASDDGQAVVVVVGISSYGYGCAKPDFPGVYSRVSSYADWIVSTIQKNS